MSRSARAARAGLGGHGRQEQVGAVLPGEGRAPAGRLLLRRLRRHWRPRRCAHMALSPLKSPHCTYCARLNEFFMRL